MLGGINTYSYANDNSLRWPDRTGLCLEDLCIGEAILAAEVIEEFSAAAETAEAAEAVEGAEAAEASADPKVIPIPSPPSNGCPPDDCKDRLSDYHIKTLGIDPHELKRAILGKNAPISRYELCRCKDGNIVIRNKGCTGPIIETGERM